MTVTQKYDKVAQIIFVAEAEKNYRPITRECMHLQLYVHL